MNDDVHRQGLWLMKSMGSKFRRCFVELSNRFSPNRTKLEPFFYLALLGLVIVVTAYHRQVLSMLPLGVEGDGPGYIFYASELEEHGFRGVNAFWQPGYSFLILVFRWLGADPFTAGVTISTIAGLLLIVVSYMIAATLFSTEVSPWTAVLVASSNLLILNACSVNSHMLYSLLFACCLLVLLRSDGVSLQPFAVAGAIAGLAYMVRQQALVIIVFFFFRTMMAQPGKRLPALLLGILSFAVVASPVFIAYSLRYGNPFYNEHYLNLAGSVYYKGDMMLFFHGGFRTKFSSWSQVLFQDPFAVFQFLVRNFFDALINMVTSLHVLFVGVLSGVGIIINSIQRRRYWAILAILLCVLSALPIRMQPRYLLPTIPFVMSFAAWMGLTLGEMGLAQIPARMRIPVKVWAGRLLFILFLCHAIASGHHLLKNEDPVFRKIGKMMTESISSRDRSPFLSEFAFHIGYYAQRRGIAMSPSRFGRVHDGVEGTHKALREKLNQDGARYLVYFSHPDLGRQHRELDHLADPRKAPPFLQAIKTENTPRIVIYRVRG